MKKFLGGLVLSLLLVVTAICFTACGTNETEQAHIHAPVYCEDKAATCTVDGNIGYWSCSCGKFFADEQATKQLAWSDIEIKKLGHTEEAITGKKATCTENGLTDGVKCSVCGETITAQETILASHTPSDWIIDNAANCKTTGSKHKECTVCHSTLATEAISKTAHTEEVITGTPATCTESGLSDGVKCSVCGDILTPQTPVPAGHKSSDWIIDDNATCTATGSKHKECTVCHETLETDTIEKSAHTEKIVSGTPATCTDSGMTDGVKCSVCNTVITAQTIIPAKGHNFVDGVCSACGAVEEPATITAVTGGTVNNETYVIDMFVEYNVSNVPLSKAITCTAGSTWKLYRDIGGQTEIPTKIAANANGTLTNGNNTFYILVSANDGADINVYTLKIYRSYSVSVKYYDDSTLLKTETAYTGKLFTAEYQPELTGYTFNHWEKSDSTVFTADTLWAALNLYINKSVNNYTVTLNVDGGDELVNNTVSLTYNENYTLAVPTRTGYTFLGWYNGDTAYTNADGASKAAWTDTETNSLTAKWQINKYRVSIICDRYAGTGTGAGNYDYGTSVTITASTPNSGYNWVGWFIDETPITEDLSYTFNIGAENVTYTAKYAAFSGLDNFIFEIKENDTYNISGVKDNTLTEIIVPECVTSISLGAFRNCTMLETISIPFIGGSVSASGADGVFGYIFGYDTNNSSGGILQYEYDGRFETLRRRYYYFIPDTLRNVIFTGSTIKERAFYNCNMLQSITISSSTTVIGNDAFYCCYGLQELHIDDLTKWCEMTFSSSSLNPLMYAHNLYLNGTLITALEIPDSVTSIGNYAFYGCSGLTSVTIPDSVTSIGVGAFEDCSGLQEVYISNLTKWCEISFAGYYSNPLGCAHNLYFNGTLITALEIPNSVTSIGEYTFYGCSGLTSVIIPDSVTSIGAGAFSRCSGLTSVTIPNNVTSIGSEAFSGCTGLTSVTIPDSVTSIASYAFYGCSGLTSVTIPDNVTSIGKSAFENCSGLTSIIIPDSITSIGNYAFDGCSGLRKVYYKTC